jgi:hypothetical protein
MTADYLVGLTGIDGEELSTSPIHHVPHSAQQDSLETSRLKAWAPILSASAIVG